MGEQRGAAVGAGDHVRYLGVSEHLVTQLRRALGRDAGRHARSAVGVAALPMDAPVEVEAIVEVG